MYEQSFSRSHPGCLVVLLDRSHSMDEPWGASGLTLAQGAAQAINKILLELCLKSTKEVGGRTRDYFAVAVYGYGACPVAGGEGVESALGGALTGRDIVPLSDLCSNPLPVPEESSIDGGSAGSRVPVWIEPIYGYRTPMCEAIAIAGARVMEWAKAHPDSFPPVVINITDGMVTDSPFKGADLATWAQRLTGIRTKDGAALLFNIFLSRSPEQPRFLPGSAQGLPAPGPELFEISSPLPQPLINYAESNGEPVEPGARGFAFQATFERLVKFLEIGTRVGDIRDRRG